MNFFIFCLNKDATTQCYFCLGICSFFSFKFFSISILQKKIKLINKIDLGISQGGLFTLGRHNSFTYNHKKYLLIPIEFKKMKIILIYSKNK